MIRSDSGPAFVYQVTQRLANILGIDLYNKLYYTYRSQSSRQVQSINKTLKETWTKLTQETGNDWVTLLPFALYQIWNSPYQLGLTPFNIMFRIPSSIILSIQSMFSMKQVPLQPGSIRASMKGFYVSSWPHPSAWRLIGLENGYTQLKTTLISKKKLRLKTPPHLPLLKPLPKPKGQHEKWTMTLTPSVFSIFKFSTHPGLS